MYLHDISDLLTPIGRVFFKMGSTGSVELVKLRAVVKNLSVLMDLFFHFSITVSENPMHRLFRCIINAGLSLLEANLN